MGQQPPKGRRTETDDLGNTGKRTGSARRSPELEEALHQLNDHLASAAPAHMVEGPLPFAPVFVVGCPRSGSTLLMQDIAMRGALGYPTNLMSRFFGDPWVGALAHKILHDLDLQGEIFPEKPALNADSYLGKTPGAAGPHEFWYWWRRYFRYVEHHGETIVLDSEQRRMFRRDLAGMMTVLGRPMVFKAMMTTWSIALVHEIVPEAIFLFLERDVEANACSLLRARETFYGDRAQWWAFRPPETKEILRLDPLEQVFAQVHHTHAAVRAAFKDLPVKNRVHWRYEEFCASPMDHHQALLHALGWGAASDTMAPSAYEVRPANWPGDVDLVRIADLRIKYR